MNNAVCLTSENGLLGHLPRGPNPKQTPPPSRHGLKKASLSPNTTFS